MDMAHALLMGFEPARCVAEGTECSASKGLPFNPRTHPAPVHGGGWFAAPQGSAGRPGQGAGPTAAPVIRVDGAVGRAGRSRPVRRKRHRLLFCFPARFVHAGLQKARRGWHPQVLKAQLPRLAARMRDDIFLNCTDGQ
ncbi:hypothetical protein GCM10010306_025790 [Streptomyces umbrinus]|nr:hypothetical protein GCM10010306_025790 [Streptomyces umbrinus]